jgi:uncharacterized protein with von Willebrand factor type A (vWA) domain
LTAFAEKGFIIVMSDGLDHFDRNQSVELAADIAVVLF